MYTAHVHFFTNLDLFCIDNARVTYRKIRYIYIHTHTQTHTHTHTLRVSVRHYFSTFEVVTPTQFRKVGY